MSPKLKIGDLIRYKTLFGKEVVAVIVSISELYYEYAITQCVGQPDFVGRIHDYEINEIDEELGRRVFKVGHIGAANRIWMQLNV